MLPVRPVRHFAATSLVMFAMTLASTRSVAQPGMQGSAGHSSAPSGRFPGAGHPGKNQEHLLQWMDRHQDMSPEQQQKALEKEPGFLSLPPETQQRMRDHLTQLNNMPPEQRKRLLERNEAMANLSVGQRQQIRGAMQQYSSLPPERRRLVSRAFRDLREMPEPQRQAILSSDRFRSQFSDQERGAISSLLAVDPYLPVRHPDKNSDFGR
ncbi:DUF3106 domain-containing protein [Edaphobacter sp.]|uniref:DUF3106 domain-containing protein n=1 Tax=Edaphobacter sp. TaxID=1934404 RepID=UPI00345B7611